MTIVYLSDIKKAAALHPYRRRFHDFVRPPADALAARAAELMEPRDLTAVLMGDPPPGRSALDKREEWVPS